MAIPRTVPARSGPVGEFFTGVGLLFRGFGLVGRSPGLLLLGLVPGVIAAVIVAGGLFALVYFSGDLASLVTWFAAHWSAELRDLVRTLAQIALVAVSILVAVLTFTALTLTIGDPFYEALSKRIDDRFGGVPDLPDTPWYRTFWRNVGDSVRMIGVSLFAWGRPRYRRSTRASAAGSWPWRSRAYRSTAAGTGCATGAGCWVHTARWRSASGYRCSCCSWCRSRRSW